MQATSLALGSLLKLNSGWLLNASLNERRIFSRPDHRMDTRLCEEHFNRFCYGLPLVTVIVLVRPYQFTGTGETRVTDALNGYFQWNRGYLSHLAHSLVDTIVTNHKRLAAKLDSVAKSFSSVLLASPSANIDSALVAVYTRELAVVNLKHRLQIGWYFLVVLTFCLIKACYFRWLSVLTGLLFASGRCMLTLSFSVQETFVESIIGL